MARRRTAMAGGAAALVAAGSVFLLGGTGNEKDGSYQYRVPEKTNDGWETGSLSNENMDPRLISQLFQRINDQAYTNINSVLLVRNNKLVAEEYFPGMQPVIGDTLEQEPDWNGKYQTHDRDTLHTLQSTTKSVNSILVGIAIDQGLIQSVDEKISTFFPEYTGRDNVRLKHFLSMTAGLEWNEHEVPISDPRNDCDRMNHTDDPVRFLMERPVVIVPGTRFAYNSAVSVTLGEIVHKVSGLSVDRFAESNLFKPLGIRDVAWKGRFPNGVIHTGGGLYLRPRDMAKIGCLMLNNGRWNGKEIVSKNWVRESTKKQAADYEYGYQWWLHAFKVRDDWIKCFWAGGYGGQFIFVFPSLRLVVVSTGWNPGRGGQIVDMMERFILPAVR